MLTAAEEAAAGGDAGVQHRHRRLESPADPLGSCRCQTDPNGHVTKAIAGARRGPPPSPPSFYATRQQWRQQHDGSKTQRGLRDSDAVTQLLERVTTYSAGEGETSLRAAGWGLARESGKKGARRRPGYCAGYPTQGRTRLQNTIGKPLGALAEVPGAGAAMARKTGAPTRFERRNQQLPLMAHGSSVETPAVQKRRKSRQIARP